MVAFSSKLQIYLVLGHAPEWRKQISLCTKCEVRLKNENQQMQVAAQYMVLIN